jgi:ABC-type transport system involved in multi-copper enzyme maturation permease subunit
MKIMITKKILRKKIYLSQFLILFLILVTIIFHYSMNMYRIKMKKNYYSEVFISNNKLIARKFDERNSLY